MKANPINIDQFQSVVESTGGDVIIKATQGKMRIMTTSADGKGHWVELTARQVFSLKNAIAVYERLAIENGW